MKLELDQYVPGLLLWLSNKVSSSATQLYRTRFGIGVTDWRVLAYFEIYPGTTASSACELMGLDKAAVSRSVTFLLERGSLKARPDGLRKILYSTTASGRRLHDQVYELAKAREDALLEGLSTADRAALLRSLHRMLKNLNNVQDIGSQ